MGVILWLSDLHLDPFYGTSLASSHKTGNNCSMPENATLLEHPYGRVGCDAPPSLLEFALENAAKHAGSSDSNKNKNKIDFILITGDFARHSMDQLSESLGASMYDPVGSILSTCIQSIQEALPNVPIVPVLGNNDVVPDYYLGLETSRTAETMLDTVAFGLKDAFLAQEEFFAFSHGGYFSRLVDLPTQQQEETSSILVLSLNTVLYSVNHQPDPKSQDANGNLHHSKDPFGQFEWIKSQLRMAAASSTADTNRIVGIYLAGHIPPSIGSYRHSQLWHDQYLHEFSIILQDYSTGKYNPPPNQNQPQDNNNSSSSSIAITPNFPPPILGHFYGHVHTEEFRLLTYDSIPNKGRRARTNETAQTNDANNNGTKSTINTIESTTPMATNEVLSIPVLVTSSITPIYGCNPSYRLVEYNDQSGALLDYTTHYLDLDHSTIDKSQRNDDAWIRLPSFVEAYGVPDLSLASFQGLVERLEEEFIETIEMECGKSHASNSNAASNNTSSNLNLWETFWNRQDLYSSNPDDADDSEFETSPTPAMMDWLCTFRASTKQDYESCLEAQQLELPCGQVSGDTTTPTTTSNDDASTFSFSPGGRPLALIVAAASGLALFGIVAVCLWKKRASKRKLYFIPNDDDDREHGDGVFVIDDDGNIEEDHVEISADVEATPNENGQLA